MTSWIALKLLFKLKSKWLKTFFLTIFKPAKLPLSVINRNYLVLFGKWQSFTFFLVSYFFQETLIEVTDRWFVCARENIFTRPFVDPTSYNYWKERKKQEEGRRERERETTSCSHKLKRRQTNGRRWRSIH